MPEANSSRAETYEMLFEFTDLTFSVSIFNTRNESDDI